MNKVIDKGFRSCRFVSTIVKHPVYDFETSYVRCVRFIKRLYFDGSGVVYAENFYVGGFIQ